MKKILNFLSNNSQFILNSIVLSLVFWVTRDGYQDDVYKFVLLMILLVILSVMNHVEGYLRGSRDY